MSWQDIVITIATIAFSLALIPQVYEGFKSKRGMITLSTSTPTFLGLYVMSFTYITLHLYLSTIVTAITGTLWFVLFFQRLLYPKA